MTEWAAEFAEPAWGNRELLVESCGNGVSKNDEFCIKNEEF